MEERLEKLEKQEKVGLVLEEIKARKAKVN
jgi:hypothetical protein